MSDKTKKSPTTSSNADSDDNKAERRGKRLDFLLKQTEMFSHFLSTTGTKPKKSRGGVNSPVSPSKAASHDSNESVFNCFRFVSVVSFFFSLVLL